MSTPKVSIIIVTWNSAKFLPYCLGSIFEQSFRDFEVVVIDNGSTDGSVEEIESAFASDEATADEKLAVIQNKENLGFAKANNQGIKSSHSEYILFCNPDIILESDFLEKAIRTIKKDEKIGSAGGKLFKIQWSNEELPKPIKTDIIDSYGIRVTKSHRALEIGSGKKDYGQYDKEREVFGISGALVLYRRSALEQIKYEDEYFDEDFFAYKEDVDLAWRLRLGGFKSVYNPKVQAYHFRGVSQELNRKRRSTLVNQLSYKNHLLALVKNQTLTNFILYFPFIFFYELGKFFCVLFFEQSTLKGLFKFFEQLPRALEKRKAAMQRRRVTSEDLEKWFK